MLDVAKESRMRRGVDGQEECSSSRVYRRQLGVVLERRRRGEVTGGVRWPVRDRFGRDGANPLTPLVRQNQVAGF